MSSQQTHSATNDLCDIDILESSVEVTANMKRIRLDRIETFRDLKPNTERIRSPLQSAPFLTPTSIIILQSHTSQRL